MHELEEDKCHTKNGCGEGCQRGECPQEGVWKNDLRAGSVEWGPKLCRIWGPDRPFRVDDVKFNPCRCTSDASSKEISVEGQDYGKVKVTTTDTEHEECPEGMHELEEDKCHTKNGCGEGCQRGECPQEGVWKNDLRAGSVEWGPKLCRIWGPDRPFRNDDVKFNPCR